MAFQLEDDSKRFWIKGRKFSMRGLLGDETYSSKFGEGSLVIFRLAPQDYHRFHVPISSVVEKFIEIPGPLYYAYNFLKSPGMGITFRGITWP